MGTRHNRDAANSAPAHRRVAVDQNLAVGAVHRLHTNGSCLVSVACVFITGAHRAQVQLRAFTSWRIACAPWPQRLHVNGKKLRRYATYTMFRTSLRNFGSARGCGEPVEGNGIEGHIVRSSSSFSVVEDHTAPGLSEERPLRASGFMEIRMSCRSCARSSVLADANGEPGGSPAMLEGKVLARDRHAHVKDAAQQNRVGRLRPEPFTVAIWMEKSLTIR